MINKKNMPKIINRSRVNNVLSEMFEVPLFFISASMGYGKTTLVKNFLKKKKDIKVIYIDNEENNDILIWNKFCDYVKSINFKLSEKLRAYGVPENNNDAYKIIELIRDEIKQKTVLVIDDWKDTKSCINYLIKNVVIEEIPNFYIVIISRNKPSDEYIELELKQKCIIMNQENIAFNFDETMEFFKINGVLLNNKEKREVYEYTGGWISAAYLALLQYYEEKTFDNIPKAAALIKKTIYDKFDDTTKEILLKLAIAENFTLEQAYFITENRNCNIVIKNLMLNNCFIKYDRKSKLYTLHSIFINALKDELVGSHINFYRINNLTGDWYSQNNNYIKAIEYYYRSKNFEAILDLLESTYLIELRDLSPKVINSIFEELTIEKKLMRPISYLNYIFFCILQGKAMLGAKLLYEAKAIYESDEKLENKNNILGEISVVESFLMFNDVKKMNQYHKKAYELLNGDTSKIANSKMPFTFGSPRILYLYHINKGKLKELVDDFETEIGYFVHISNGGGSGSEYLMKGEYFFEIGDIENGELYAYKALYKGNLKKQTSIIICSLFLLMRIFINKNNKTEVKNNLNNLIKEYENFNIPNFLNLAEIARGYINGITGKLEEIPMWLRHIDLSNAQIALSDKSMGYIVSGIAMILNEEFVELEVYSEMMIEAYLKNNNIFGILYGYIFQSVCNYKIYGIKKAKKSLLNAIELAQNDNIMMCFIELAPHILPILKELKEENTYVELLLLKCERFNEIYEESYSEKVKIQLTARELEVIELLAQGYKQCEISEKLNIALVTVKKHISSVYFKTNTKNKAAALKRLKNMQII